MTDDDNHPVLNAIAVTAIVLWGIIDWIFPFAAGAAIWIWWKG